MAYDFWDTLKKYLKGELKVGNTAIKPTLNPVENIATIQKVSSAANKKTTQPKSATQKPQTKASGFAAPKNPVINSVANMIQQTASKSNKQPV